MRTFTSAYGVLLAALTLLPLGTQAGEPGKKLVAPIDRTIRINGHDVPVVSKMKAGINTNNPTKNTTSLSPKSWYSTTETQERLIENFDKFTAGSETEPDGEALCDEYGYFGGPAQFYIDDKYTETPGWCGSWVFQAGGNAYLNDPFGYIGAVLNSPLGDYSGNITVTLRVKNIGKSSCSLFVNVLKDGYYNPKFADTDDGSTSLYTNIYPNRGWMTLTLNAHNMTSAADGFLQILAYGSCIIDYVHIERTNNYIAPPTVTDISHFTDSTFTVSWDKEDLAYNYWMWLYKKNYTSTEDRTWTSDCESTLPEGFSTTGTIVDGIGADGSKGLRLANGDTLTTPYNFSEYKNASFWMQVKGADKDVLEESAATIDLDVLTTSGWEEWGSFYAEYWTTGGTADLQESSYNKFGGNYMGVRIRPNNFPEGAYLAIDSLNVQAGRDAELLPVGVNEEYGYYYDYTKNTTYTFSEGLEADADYYFGVQSHYNSLVSEYPLQLAFGVAAPVATPATDIDSRGSYTANWEPSAKATGYRVDNFGLTTAEKDGTYDIIDEDFSGVDADVTESTDPTDPDPLGDGAAESLDDYTKLPGWIGYNYAVSQGWMGAINDDYTSGYIKTPALYLANDSVFNITIKATGTAGDYLAIKSPTQTYYIEFDESGTIDGTFIVPESGSALVLRIKSDDTFMIDHIKISQNLKAGDHFYSWLSSATVDGKETTSTAFSNLYDYEFDKYAYAVTATRTEGSRYAESDLSDYILVDLEDGKSVPTSIADGNIAGSTAKVVARYNTAGQMVSAPQAGLNIVKMSDGSVRKVIVRK